MLFIYVFTLLRSTTVRTQDAKDGKQAVYYWAISLVQTGLDCDIPVSTSRVPGVTFWSTYGIWFNMFLNTFTFYYIYLFSYVCVFFSCVCRPVIMWVGELRVYILAFVYICGGVHVFVQWQVWECAWVVCVHMCVPVHICHMTHEKVRGPLVLAAVLSLYHVCSGD